MNTEAIRAIVETHIRNHNPAADLSGLTGSTNMLREGLIDSMAFLDLIAQLEELSGRTVDFLEVDPEALISLDGLGLHFAGET